MPLGSSSDCRLDRTYWLPGVEGPELPWEAGRLSELADDIRALSKGVQCSDRSDGGVGQAVQRVYIEVLYARCRDGQGQVCGCRASFRRLSATEDGRMIGGRATRVPRSDQSPAGWLLSSDKGCEGD